MVSRFASKLYSPEPIRRTEQPSTHSTAITPAFDACSKHFDSADTYPRGKYTRAVALAGIVTRSLKLSPSTTHALFTFWFGLLFTYCLEKITRASNMRLEYFDQKPAYFNTWNPPSPNRTNPCSVAAIYRSERECGHRQLRRN